ncbi:MAG: archaemetzincin family Zn-dependent metalloprotease [Thermodesulfobacteriota bacterium]
MMSYIYLVPIHLRAADWMERLQSGIERAFGVRTKRGDRPIDLAIAYDPVRKQYSSSAILLQLIDSVPDDMMKILGITDVDLFVPVLSYVFGEAQLDGIGAVVSVHRLKNSFYGLSEDNERMVERLVKEAVHELGHTFGLFHCNRVGCALNASTYVEDIDQKSELLCVECRKAIGLGW